MPFKAEDMANSHYTKIEAEYIDEIYKARDTLLFAEQDVEWSPKGCCDTDACKENGRRIADFAHAAKALRYLAEAAIKDSQLQYEKAGECWEGFHTAEITLEHALDAESRAMRYFAAWVLDTDGTYDFHTR